MNAPAKPKQPAHTLDARLSLEQGRLLDLKSALTGLTAVRAEFDRVRRGKSFRVQDDFAWLMVISTYDMLIVELASWFKGIGKDRGLLKMAMGNLGEIPLRRSWRDRHEGTDAWLRNKHNADHEEHFSELFPEIPYCRRGALPADVDKLGKDLLAEADALVHERHKRAHCFEYDEKRPNTQIDLPEISALFNKAWMLTWTLRFVSSGTNSDNPDWLLVSAEAAARDVVDQVVIGTSRQRQLKLGSRKRDDYYDTLHAAHDALGPATTKLFNEVTPEGD